MRFLRIAALCAFGLLFATAQDYWVERKFYENSCLACHTMEHYLWPRTYKSWELTIANMRGYIGDDSILNEEDGQRIALFLTEYVGEGELLVPPDMEMKEAEPSSPMPVDESTASAPEPVVTEESPAVETVVEEIEKPVPPVEEGVGPEPSVESAPAVAEPVQETETKAEAPVYRTKMQMPLLKGIWNPGRAALKGARLTGFLAVAALLGLLISGFARKKLKRNFRPVHKWSAWVLFVALTVHGVIYIFEYGTPQVLWYWFGFAGLTVLIAVQVQGKLRRRFNLGPLSWHIAAGCAGLVLSILHWIWAWL